MIGQGLQLSLAGLAVTFGALAALVLIIVILVELFSRQDMAARVPSAAPAAATDDREIVAAVAAALGALGSSGARDEGLGACLAAGQGAWWRENPPRQPDAWPVGGRW